MANGYSQSPKLLKGAIIQFSAPLLIPIPNIILFQYNPESMTRSLTPWARPAPTEGETPDSEAALAQPFDPQESFNITLELDAADALEQPDTHPIASIFGVADRIAALEMLLYPPGESALLGLVSAVRTGTVPGVSVDVVERRKVPVVLFFWGPGRIVPVRITSFSVDEQAYSPTLYPIRATVTLGMKVLDAAAFRDEDSATIKIAKACYTYTRAQKETLALGNVANSVESIMGMLPF